MPGLYVLPVLIVVTLYALPGSSHMTLSLDVLKHCCESGSHRQEFFSIFLMEVIYILGVLHLIPLLCPIQFHKVLVLYLVCCNLCFHAVIFSFEHNLHVFFTEKAKHSFCFRVVRVFEPHLKVTVVVLTPFFKLHLKLFLLYM